MYQSYALNSLLLLHRFHGTFTGIFVNLSGGISRIFCRIFCSTYGTLTFGLQIPISLGA